MSRRRFSILAVALVTLNLVLWLAPQGLALRDALVNQLFGPRMIRAEVVLRAATGGAPVDYRVDRGVITSVTSTTVTLREQDGTTTSVNLSGATRVTGRPRFRTIGQLRRNLRVLVVHQANGPAEVVQVEGRGFLP